MKKVLLIIYAGTESHESMARVTNAFMMAKELDEHDHTVEIAFDGAGVQWLERLESGESDLSELYNDVRDNVSSVCDFCVGAFESDVDEDLREDSYEGHQSFVEYFEDDWKIVTF